MALFAPPDLFAAIAAAARADADVPDGVHVRLMPSPALGFPLAPFAIYRVRPSIAEPQVFWRDRRGNPLPSPSLEAAGGVLIADLTPPSGSDDRDVAVALLSDGSFSGSIALIDRVANRVFSERSEPPFIVGGPRVDRVRISGRGQVLGLQTWRVEAHIAVESMFQDPVALLSLPIDGSRPWDSNGLGPGPAFDQVSRGAALRLQQPDRPDGPFDPLTPADEVTRVEAHAPDIDKSCEEMLGDIAIPPRLQRRTHHQPATATARDQYAGISLASTLLVQAMDPGIGRYLGLLGTIDERSDGSEPIAYVALGVFAFFSRAKAPDGRTIDAALGQPPAWLDRVGPRVEETLRLRELLERLTAHYGRPTFAHADSRLQTRGLLAVAGAVPLADWPRLGVPAMGSSQWLPGSGGPSTSFRQQFIFTSSPLGALVALGRLEGGAWRTRHRTIDLPAPASPSRRALAMLLGRTQPTPRDVGLLKVSASYMRRGLIADSPIPAGDTPAKYRAALADFFGRFGPPAEFDLATPKRPAPPVPAPQIQVVLDGPDGVGGPPASPGHVKAAIVVPSVAELAVGSLDIASLDVWLDGGTPESTTLAPIPAGTTQTVTSEFVLPVLAVGATGTSRLTAQFTDSAGVTSEIADVAVTYADRRRPFVVPTGLGLIWTSKPGPSPDVELKLVWPAHPGTRYRVYIADEKTLALTGNSRAKVAVEGGNRDRAHMLGGRNQFRLLTDPPLEATGSTVTLNERLPRALTTVQFVRVVPLTAKGREAEFHLCGVVPVAVPTDRTPPPPRVSVSVDPDTRVASVTIVAQGLDLVELQASEPGLFTQPPQAGAVAPEFRLRRASGPVTDPVYAREIARGPLTITRDGGEVSVSATIEDPGALESFIRYSYWAEVRMPPERRVTPEVTEVPPAGGVGPVNAAQVADMPRPFSLVSAPVTALHAPPLPVPALEDLAASIIAEAGSLRASLTATSTPSASPKAIGPYRLRIWEQWGAKAIGAATDVELDGSSLAWEGTPVPDDPSHPRPLTVRVVVIDPLGREGEMTTITRPVRHALVGAKARDIGGTRAILLDV